MNVEKIKGKWKRKWESAVKDPAIAQDIMEAKADWQVNAAAKEDEWFKEIQSAYKEHKFSKGILRPGKADEWAKETIKGLREKAERGLDRDDVDRFVKNAMPYISLVKYAKARFNKIKWPDPATKAKHWIDLVMLLKIAKGAPEKVSEVRSKIEELLSKWESEYGIAEALKAAGVPAS